MSFRRARRLLPWLLPSVALAIGVLLLCLATGVLGNADRPFELGDVGSIQFVLNTNAAALTSAMGVLIALVLLSVQVTAQRYSFNVIGMFIKNWVNAVLISFFILTIVFNLWLGTDPERRRSDQAPGLRWPGTAAPDPVSRPLRIDSTLSRVMAQYSPVTSRLTGLETV